MKAVFGYVMEGKTTLGEYASVALVFTWTRHVNLQYVLCTQTPLPHRPLPPDIKLKYLSSESSLFVLK